MRQTENLGLNLPEGPDPYNEKDYNDNFEIIDDKLKYLADHIGGGGTYGTLTAYVNGIYEASQDPEIDAWDKVVVAVTPLLMNRTITENGIYSASQETPVSYEGYGTVIIDVPASKVLISDFDFLGNSPYYDQAKKVELATNMKGLDYTAGTGLTVSGRGQRLRPGVNFGYAEIYELEIKFGTFDRTTDPTTYTNNILLKVVRSSSYLMLCYNYNTSTAEGKWWIHDQTNNNIYLDGITDPYYFENKTVIMTYGAKYENGELVRDINKGYFYVDGVQLNSTGASLVGDVDSQIQVVFLCDSENNAFLGAVYKSLKIWQYFNKYETPVSLMSAAPEQINEIIEETEEPEDSEER